MKGLQDLMKQASQLQERLGEVQKSLEQIEVAGESGGGLVRVTMTGRHELRAVHLEPSLMREDREVIEDLVAAAVNDAVRRLEQRRRDAMAEVTGGLGLPPGMSLPF